jgi:TetR/AcrR family acrAB operon transcriptional repressor
VARAKNAKPGEIKVVRKTKEDAEKTRQDIIESARTVFHQCGVSRSTLEKIAKEAGVTRGAIYWHFKDKAELFFAMREDVFAPMVERTDALLLSDVYDNPLDAIEASLKEFFRVLDDCPVVREVFEIMISRCEYVDEFAAVQEEAGRPAYEFLEKMERVYGRAAEKGVLRPGLDPETAARDTWAFTSGLLHLMLGCQKGSDLDRRIPAMITSHMRLRRLG